jgi:hypothetical protein
MGSHTRSPSILSSVEPSSAQLSVSTPASRGYSIDVLDSTAGLPSVKNVRLTEGDNEILAQLCSGSKSTYLTTSKTQFWANISAALEQKTGKKIANSRSAMMKLVYARRAQLNRWKTETGTVQEETDLSQAVDSFIEVLDQETEGREDRRKCQEATQQELKERLVQENNLLESLGNKKRAYTEEDDEDLPSDFPGESGTTSRSRSTSTRGRSRSRCTRKSRRIYEEELENGQQMVEAVKLVAEAIKCNASSNEKPLDERLARLENTQDERFARLENTQKDLLATNQKLLSLMECMQAQRVPNMEKPTELPQDFPSDDL